MAQTESHLYPLLQQSDNGFVPSSSVTDALIIWINALGMSQRALAEATGIKRTRLQRVLHADPDRRASASFEEIESLKRILDIDEYDIAVSQELAGLNCGSGLESEMRIIASLMRGLPTRLLQKMRLVPGLSFDEVTDDHASMLQAVVANRVEKSLTSFSRLCARQNEERIFGIAAE